MITKSNGNWQQLFSGSKYYPATPNPEVIEIEDVAHHLSLICRYAGACSHLYSVGAHSLIMSHYASDAIAQDSSLPRELPVQALLHDAAEMIIGDVPRPSKRLSNIKEVVEHSNLIAIFERFGVPFFDEAIMEDLDIILLKWEHSAFMSREHDWGLPVSRFEDERYEVSSTVVSLVEITMKRFCHPFIVEQTFLKRAKELGLE